MLKINIVKDFSPHPYGRNKHTVIPEEVNSTGEVFRETLLLPKLQEARNTKKKLEVDLTGFNRYGRSFIDEAFGGVVRNSDFTLEELKNILVIKHLDVPSLVCLAWHCIEHPER